MKKSYVCMLLVLLVLFFYNVDVYAVTDVGDDYEMSEEEQAAGYMLIGNKLFTPEEASAGDAAYTSNEIYGSDLEIKDNSGFLTINLYPDMDLIYDLCVTIIDMDSAQCYTFQFDRETNGTSYEFAPLPPGYYFIDFAGYNLDTTDRWPGELGKFNVIKGELTTLNISIGDVNNSPYDLVTYDGMIDMDSFTNIESEKTSMEIDDRDIDETFARVDGSEYLLTDNGERFEIIGIEGELYSLDVFNEELGYAAFDLKAFPGEEVMEIYRLDGSRYELFPNGERYEWDGSRFDDFLGYGVGDPLWEIPADFVEFSLPGIPDEYCYPRYNEPFYYYNPKEKTLIRLYYNPSIEDPNFPATYEFEWIQEFEREDGSKYNLYPDGTRMEVMGDGTLMEFHSVSGYAPGDPLYEEPPYKPNFFERLFAWLNEIFQ